MKKLLKIFIGGLVVITVLFGLVWHTNQDQNLEVYFFDVGQGDAILIRTPFKQNILIDGGPDNSLITKLGQALPFYDRTIDLMVLTHPHNDHLFGLIEVLKRYQVKQVLFSGVVYSTAVYGEWLGLVKEKKIPLKIAVSGQNFIFGQLELKVLYPFKSYAGKVVQEKAGEMEISDGKENLNNSSVVIQLTYQKIKMLFMGDLEQIGEEEILKFNQNLPGLTGQVIKLGHHGSGSSSGERFLAQVNPQFAIIQVGKDNKFNLPNSWVIARLKRLKAKVLRTDLLGDIRVWSDGFILKLSPNSP